MKKYVIIEGSIDGTFSNISFDTDSVEKVGYDKETHSTHIVLKEGAEVEYGNRKHWEMSLTPFVEGPMITHIESLAF